MKEEKIEIFVLSAVPWSSPGESVNGKKNVVGELLGGQFICREFPFQDGGFLTIPVSFYLLYLRLCRQSLSSFKFIMCSAGTRRTDGFSIGFPFGTWARVLQWAVYVPRIIFWYSLFILCNLTVSVLLEHRHVLIAHPTGFKSFNCLKWARSSI